MDIEKAFARLTEHTRGITRDPDDRMKVSLNLRVADVYMAGRLANVLELNRQDVLSTIIENGLPEAVDGYYKIEGNNPLEHMAWDDFNDAVEQGKYIG